MGRVSGVLGRVRAAPNLEVHEKALLTVTVPLLVAVAQTRDPDLAHIAAVAAELGYRMSTFGLDEPKHAIALFFFFFKFSHPQNSPNLVEIS